MLGQLPHCWAARTVLLAWGSTLQHVRFDIAVCPVLLAELQPRTIIELGSDSGGSAVRLAELLRVQPLEPRILLVDHRPVAVDNARVDRVAATSGASPASPGMTSSIGLVRPLLVIEDVRDGVEGVLRHPDYNITGGDYLVVEDSIPKRGSSVVPRRQTGRLPA